MAEPAWEPGPTRPDPTTAAQPGRPPAIAEAIRLNRKGDREASHAQLRDFLAEQPGQVEALVWLAKVTGDPQEAIAAANLAARLDPANEVARRAVAAVHEMYPDGNESGLGKNGSSLAIAFATGMTLAQARSVTWPTRGINRPIGEALDDQTLTLRDLGWAVENAWDPRVRDAAKTILLTELMGTGPAEPPRGLKVIRGSRYTEDQERSATLELGATYGRFTTLLVGLLVVAVAVALLDFFGIAKFPPWILLLITLSVGLLGLSLGVLQRRRDEADAYQAGRRGEERAVEELTYHLDGRWTLFRNLEWPDRSWGDVDLVLVGPRGVAAFEVKAYCMRTRNIGDRWQRWTRWGWRKHPADPGRQVNQNAANVRQYLLGHGVKINWVEAVVLWAGKSDLLSVQDPATRVWRIDEVGDRLDDLWARKPLTEETVQQAVTVLQQALQTNDPTERP